MKVVHVTKRDFKYGDRIIRKGEIFTPSGGRFDDKILDPSNGFVFQKMTAYTCEQCGREFEKPQGLAGHSRHCKG